jgi:hypothetical protein
MDLRWFLFHDIHFRDLIELEIARKNGQIKFSFNNFLSNSNKSTGYNALKLTFVINYNIMTNKCYLELSNNLLTQQVVVAVLLLLIIQLISHMKTRALLSKLF